jgi:hypothetical protein
MADERRAMYDEFSDTVNTMMKEFLKLAFVGGHHEVSCPCNRCEYRRMFSKYEMSAHLAKKEFMSNYLLWHQYGEVQHAVVDESDGNNDVD